MQKIAIDARESGTSTGRYIDKLIEYLAKDNTDFEFTIMTKLHRVEYIKSIAPKFNVISTDIKEFTFAEQLSFKNLIKQLHPDLVHFGVVQQPILYRGKVVTTIHDLIMTWEDNPSRNKIVHYLKQRVYRWVIKRAARKSLTVITPTKFIKNDVANFTKQPISKFEVTYESADKFEDKAVAVKELVGKKFIMYVGRPMPHKNLEKLIEAFELLSKDMSDLVLVLAGKKDFNYQRIEDGARAKKIKNVFFTDYISDGQLKWLYENCAAYVFPSISEGFGLPALEAMVHGAPVVSSNATCLPEVYGEAAKYFDPNDIEDMASAIKEVLEDKDLRNSLIQMGHMQAKKYSWERMAKQTLEVYKKALK